MKKRHLLQASLLSLAFITAPAMAGWTLDNKNSILHYISVKNTSVAEVNHFTELDGFINDDGLAEIEISLNSVKTNIEIRDQRVREILFETNRFPSATITASVDTDELDKLAISESIKKNITATVSLHGKMREVPAELTVTRISDKKLQVNTSSPILIDANDYALAEGLKALQVIAKLDSISTAVPVTFSLVFDQQ